MLGNILFPYEEVRNVQKKLLAQVHHAINYKKNLISHAPTGIGKTAAVLAPALTYAIENKKVVFFLTSRHTQHQIAIDTLKEIKQKHKDANFNAIDIVGKKWLCLQDGVTDLSSGDFNEYCRKMKEDELCTFYLNLKKGEKISVDTRRALQQLKKEIPQETEKIRQISEDAKVCPYEVSMMLTKDAHLIVTDYYYIFSPKIRENFLKRMGKELEDSIIIVDEAHNLPERLKNLSSHRMSNIMVIRAIQEAKKYGHGKLASVLEDINELFTHYSKQVEEEDYVDKLDFFEKVDQCMDYDVLMEELAEEGGKIREEQRISYMASVAEFLEAWKGRSDGYARILTSKPGSRGPIVTLSYRCLDPSMVTREVVEEAHSTIMISGTLTPTSMYRELMGMDDAVESTFENPFPEKNRLSLIVPKTTTKYSRRNDKNYKDMAEIIAKAVNAVPGNSIVFFPSYHIKSEVYAHLDDLCQKNIFDEQPGMTKMEKHDFLKEFKQSRIAGAVMLACTTGNFGEGVDLPGDLLKAVIIVGLPLQKPDLEVKTLIKYYDDKFGKGWDYGYLYPAFNKTLQSAGRCIRSSTDRGVVIFLDERYAWNNYRRCFPENMKPKTTLMFEKEINDFFSD